jgi:AcrR family transcriptional regulator
VGRARQPEIRERLLEACTDAALAGGLPDRLGPFAAAAGTSPRMLLYHFGTKEALLRAVLQRARARQREDFEALLRGRPDEDYRTTLGRAWTGMTTPPGRRYLEMFGRLREDAEQRLWPGFRREATTDWLAPLEDGLRTLGRPELATLVLAVVRGLIMDLDATGDTERVDRAFTDFVASLRGPADVPGGAP